MINKKPIDGKESAEWALKREEIPSAAVTHQLVAAGQVFHRHTPDMHQAAEREQHEQRHAQHHMQFKDRRNPHQMF